MCSRTLTRTTESGAPVKTAGANAPKCNRTLSSLNLFPLLRNRFNDDRVRLHVGAFAPAVLTGAPDSVVLVNVLEHILDDERLLSQIQKCLKVGGSLLLFVPASQWNFGSLDEAFEHHRRYSKPAL